MSSGIIISAGEEKRFIIEKLEDIPPEIIEDVLNLYDLWLRIDGQENSNPDVFIVRIRQAVEGVGRKINGNIPWKSFDNDLQLVFDNWKNSNGKECVDVDVFMEHISRIFDAQTDFLVTKGVAFLPTRG